MSESSMINLHEPLLASQDEPMQDQSPGTRKTVFATLKNQYNENNSFFMYQSKLKQREQEQEVAINEEQ
jgi:hypothetical protein